MPMSVATASESGSPPAVRVRGPRWKDTRLIVGLLLVLVSVAVGVQAFASADRTTPVWAAKRDLDAGSVVHHGDLVRKDVRLLDATDKYLDADASPFGYTVTRAVGVGELMPTGALSKSRASGDDREVPVPVERGRLPRGLGSNSRVDVYATVSRESSKESDTTSSVAVAADVLVSSVGDTESGLGSASTVTVTLVLPAEQIPPVLDAVSAGDVALVKVPLGSGKTSP